LVDPAPGERLIRRVKTYEEKGTDVNIAALMLKDGFNSRYESAAVISNDGDLKMPIEIVREELNLPVTVINPVLKHRRRRSAALSPNAPASKRELYSTARQRRFGKPVSYRIAVSKGCDACQTCGLVERFQPLNPDGERVYSFHNPLVVSSTGREAAARRSLHI
jgi:NYN domain